jgi:D-lyxose ketol-isomerase
LEIKTDIGPGTQRNYTTITAGQSFTVPPKVTHEFRTKDEETVIEEIAYVEYDHRDIFREQLGGDMVADG